MHNDSILIVNLMRAPSADNQAHRDDETIRSFEPVCCNYCLQGLENPDYILMPTNNSCSVIDFPYVIRIC